MHQSTQLLVLVRVKALILVLVEDLQALHSV